jgi:hypothetical protein
MKKVNLDVIRPWISNRITELIGLEDEVVIDYTCSLLEEKVISSAILVHPLITHYIYVFIFYF